MDASAAVQMLEETAVSAELGAPHLGRLRDAHSLLGRDLSRIEALLLATTADGVSPATLAATHLLTAGGKRVRPLCVLLASLAFGRLTDETRTLATVAEMVHLATLLHDDVVDDSAERRNQVVARIVFGNAVSVLAGDSLLVHALSRTSEVGRPQTLTELFATLRQLVDGEVVQLRGRTKLDASYATYATILEGKTASLFRWSLRAGARAGGATESEVDRLGVFGSHLGMAFQLVDDALDYTGEGLGKDLHADLREGKVTLPLILAVEKDPSLFNVLEKAREGDPAARETLRAAGRERASEVRERARAESESACAALSQVTDSPAKALLSGVAIELVSRLG
jgi:octaprenyl-diphosphate synthase